MLETIKQFEIDISRAYYESNSLVQMDAFRKVSTRIMNFLKKDIKPVEPEALFINATISSIWYSENENLKIPFHKNENKRKEGYYKNILNFKNELETQLKVIKSYIAQNKIMECESE
jgi:hypothetical protein